jgi:hypothetical protein
MAAIAERLHIASCNAAACATASPGLSEYVLAADLLVEAVEPKAWVCFSFHV